MKSKKSTIRDVAQLAGVSISTVSRVLNDPERAKSIPAEMQERVIQAADKLRYVPNFNARRVFMHRAEEIGLVVPSCRNLGMHTFEDRHLAKLVSGIEEELAGTNYRLLLIFNDERFVSRREYLSLIQSQHVDGLIVWGARKSEDFWHEPVEAGLPVLFACTIPGPPEEFNHVISATREGMMQLLAALYRSGHRNLLFMPQRQLVHWQKQPNEPFLSQEMHDAAVLFRETHPDLKLETVTIYSDVAEKLRADQFGRPDSPSVIITYNYNMAEEVYGYLTARGVRIPEDVELFSCYAFINEKNWISSFEANDFEMGRQAARGIFELIEDPQSEVQLEIPGKLRFRGTTKSFPAGAAETALSPGGIG